jgi:hypothetical protein
MPEGIHIPPAKTKKRLITNKKRPSYPLDGRFLLLPLGNLNRSTTRPILHFFPAIKIV